MYLRWTIINRGLSKHKLEHRSTLVPKFGETNLMEASQIFGHLAAFCIRCAAWDHPSMGKTLINYIKMFKKDITNPFLKYIRTNFSKSSTCVSARNPKIGPLLRIFWNKEGSYHRSAITMKFQWSHKKFRIRISYFRL
jgi:hypothetical protein